MEISIKNGLQNDGILPGVLKLKRRAPKLIKELNARSKKYGLNLMTYFDFVSTFALAASEENAAGGRVVTAPTNGSAGIIPAVIAYYDKFHSNQIPDKYNDFLLTAGAIGILIKNNASISGAEGGCQAEVGSACAMAAAGLTAALGGTNQQIEHAAVIGLVHNLGLTCDPVSGLVQIPCIERNAMGAIQAINASSLALQSKVHKVVSLDSAIRAMKETGDDMLLEYKETSLGGLAEVFHEKDYTEVVQVDPTKHDLALFKKSALC